MSYLEFHLFFLLPPIILLATVARPTRQDLLIVLAISAIALSYTTPWDNYLVYREVWAYGDGRVIGTIGYVPIEEYAFFVLQPLLTGLAYLAISKRSERNRPSTHFAHSGSAAKRNRRAVLRYGGAAAGLALTAVGVAALSAPRTLYLGLILTWSGPVAAGQWFLYGDRFLNRDWLTAILLPTFYLWIADRVALAQDIWSISDVYTVGLEPFGLPVEEALFFLMTNVLVVQGVMMFRGVSAPDPYSPRKCS